MAFGETPMVEPFLSARATLSGSRTARCHGTFPCKAIPVKARRSNREKKCTVPFTNRSKPCKNTVFAAVETCSFGSGGLGLSWC